MLGYLDAWKDLGYLDGRKDQPDCWAILTGSNTCYDKTLSLLNKYGDRVRLRRLV
jgi:hypothetical protein